MSTEDVKRKIAAALVAEGIKPHNPAYYPLIERLSSAFDQAQTEQADWEYARQNRLGHVTEPDLDLGDAQRRASGYPHGYTGGYQTVVRRRPAGQWEPVEEEPTA